MRLIGGLYLLEQTCSHARGKCGEKVIILKAISFYLQFYVIELSVENFAFLLSLKETRSEVGYIPNYFYQGKSSWQTLRH